MQIGFGLALSFTYIFLMQFATQFSLKGNLDPMLAMWIPNMIFLVIGVFLYSQGTEINAFEKCILCKYHSVRILYYFDIFLDN